MKGLFSKAATSVAASLLMASVCSTANALIISPSQDGLFTYDFGNVAVGLTAQVTFNVSWINENDENYVVGGTLVDSGTTLNPFHIDIISCTDSGPCSFTLSFTPPSVGSFSDSTALHPPAELPVGLLWLYNIETSSYREDGPFHLTLNGVGVSDTAPVPVPGALPLFASGLGALGFFAYRRKRKAVA